MNILSNPGFETGSLSPWFQSNSLDNGGNWAITTGNPEDGTYAAFVNGNSEIQQNFTPIPVDTISQISFWVDHPSCDSSAGTAVVFYYQDGTSSQAVPVTNDSNWHLIDVTSSLYLQFNETLVGLGIWGYTNGNTNNVTVLDEVGIFTDGTVVSLPPPPPPAPTPLPAALPLFATGLGALGLLGWRRKRKAQLAT